MAESFRLSTSVNGVDVVTNLAARSLLIDFLRDDLGLKGTKPSCDAQVCGACTVLVDGLPVSSCTFLAADVIGREVTTIEGLATEGQLHPVQQAFLDCSALQCGYCTPGFVLSIVSLLNDVPHPTADDIELALEGNICRCTGYRPIVAAVERAAQLLHQEPTT